MKTQLLYILVSSPADVYTEQVLVSATSARRRNPSAVMLLLTDSDTIVTPALQSLFDRVIRQDFQADIPPMKRSRLLKTGMRSLVEGDFLFIDADTIVARPLDGIDAMEAPLAACPDLHSHFPEHPHYEATVNMCRKLCEDYNGTVPDTIEALTTLPGVGRKTANLIVGDIFQQPAVVVDTHCIRITGRLGFHQSKDAAKIEKLLRDLLPPDRSNDFCHRLVLHGRAVCKAGHPQCHACCLQSICQYAADHT